MHCTVQSAPGEQFASAGDVVFIGLFTGGEGTMIAIAGRRFSIPLIAGSNTYRYGRNHALKYLRLPRGLSPGDLARRAARRRHKRSEISKPTATIWPCRGSDRFTRLLSAAVVVFVARYASYGHSQGCQISSSSVGQGCKVYFGSFIKCLPRVSVRIAKCLVVASGLNNVFVLTNIFMRLLLNNE